jgi:hypothetical protein
MLAIKKPAFRQLTSIMPTQANVCTPSLL